LVITLVGSTRTRIDLKNTIPELGQVLDAISDQMSLTMLYMIIDKEQTRTSLRDTLGLSRKQFYDRILKLRKAGLVKRISSKYTITSFGRVVFDAQLRVDKGIGYITKLKVIDTLTNTEIPRAEFAKLVDEWIKDEHIKYLITNRKVERQPNR
jgi:hypothetical protein